MAQRGPHGSRVASDSQPMTNAAGAKAPFRGG